jgi:programmed cell death protein 4
VQAKFLKHKDTPPVEAVVEVSAEDHETKVKEGTAKRNITRKKTDPRETGNFDSRNKKQGGHGKGKWKDDDLIGYEGTAATLDERDPLYNEEEAPYVLGSHEDPITMGFHEAEGKKILGPMLTLSEFKLQLEVCLQEYFDSCDTDEVIQSIEELQCREYHPDVVKKCISVSLDKHPRERELISRLLTGLHPTPLNDNDMEAGFNMLLDSLDDLTTDVPDARVSAKWDAFGAIWCYAIFLFRSSDSPHELRTTYTVMQTMVANFLARAIVDEVLPPAYLSDQNNARSGEIVIEKAISLLTREHSTARLERVWGPGDGRPVDELKVAMDQLLQEYLMSRELDECARCVKELDAAHYMHELVKRGVKLAMEEDGKDSATLHQKSSIDATAALFGFLVKNAIISEHQVRKGVDRLHRVLDDLKLDVPAAPTLLQDFEMMLQEELPTADEKKTE